MTFISPALRSETQDLAALRAPLSAPERLAALEIGRALVKGARARADERPYLDAFLQEFGLSNQEGIALMCLAEALLRIPDDETADRLIAEKLASGNWDSHAGRSDSLFVNASTWGLMLTGRLVELPDEVRGNTNGWLRGLTQRASEPLVRQALRRAMKIIGSEFVVGRNITEALQRSASDPSLTLCSFDMLGEGARTDRDAERYFDAYVDAIEQIGKSVSTKDPKKQGSLHERSSISIKLSALDPRYSAIHRERVHARLLPRARDLARLAATHNIGLTIDAEEQDRLEISLEIFAALVNDPETRDWQGLGLAVQAYGRRAMAVINHVTELARTSRRALTVRLVKGAYWDSEIKRAQERGLSEYPLYTRKCSTDVSYLACARALLDASDVIYPQFATHNAHTIAAVLGLARTRSEARGVKIDFEFQRLHGMGTLLYDEAHRQLNDLPRVRVYAPVGPHADLLAYLVRRLLENGANTSFVNRFMDERVAIEQVVSDPISELDALPHIEHERIPLPAHLYGDARVNSQGIDLGRDSNLEALQRCLRNAPALPPPTTRYVTPLAVENAFRAASSAFNDWRRQPVAARAEIFERAADLLEESRDAFIALLVSEAGKTAGDAIAEVRETIDFCRYYAKAAKQLQAAATTLDGPTGEHNELSHVPRGVWCCISPWNFPLAIFTGQVVAALVTGNTVVAKPAETTPEVALAMCDLLYRAGLPKEVLHVLPMVGKEFGEIALQAPSLAGVVFTGSTRTAQWLNRALAAREGAIVPLIAETGGINAMIVDSTALTEQVVDDVMSSAFGSAGQRCSALRLLCVQEDCADRILDMLEGAMEALVVGDPIELTTDVGPVITASAARDLEEHIDRMCQRGRLRKRAVIPTTTGSIAKDRFVAPALIEIDSVTALDREAFGPVLHVVRYRSDELSTVLDDLRANGYGLTLGIQTRLEGTQRSVFDATLAGNVYVNRNMIGAVVGVQPFGGTGLSGTGPKAGGPHYLLRFTTERVLTVNTTATGGNAALLTLD